MGARRALTCHPAAPTTSACRPVRPAGSGWRRAPRWRHRSGSAPRALGRRARGWTDGSSPRACTRGDLRLGQPQADLKRLSRHTYEANRHANFLRHRTLPSEPTSSAARVGVTELTHAGAESPCRPIGASTARGSGRQRLSGVVRRHGRSTAGERGAGQSLLGRPIPSDGFPTDTEADQGRAPGFTRQVLLLAQT